jgi:hypothetical protein
MPLDPRKILHIQNVTNLSFANRQRTVVLVTLSNGAYSYSTLLAIMRPLQVLNPQVIDASADPRCTLPICSCKPRWARISQVWSMLPTRQLQRLWP